MNSSSNFLTRLTPTVGLKGATPTFKHSQNGEESSASLLTQIASETKDALLSKLLAEGGTGSFVSKYKGKIGKNSGIAKNDISDTQPPEETSQAPATRGRRHSVGDFRSAVPEETRIAHVPDALGSFARESPEVAIMPQPRSRRHSISCISEALQLRASIDLPDGESATSHHQSILSLAEEALLMPSPYTKRRRSSIRVNMHKPAVRLVFRFTYRLWNERRRAIFMKWRYHCNLVHVQQTGKARYAEVALKVATCQQQLATASALLQEQEQTHRADLQSQSDTLREEIEERQQAHDLNLEHLRELLAEASETEMQKLRSTLAETQAQNHKLANKCEQLAADKGEQRAEVSKQNEAIRAQVAQLKAQTASHIETEQGLLEEMADLRQDNQRLQAQVAQLQGQNSSHVENEEVLLAEMAGRREDARVS
jgi:hypothetical protein